MSRILDMWKENGMTPSPQRAACFDYDWWDWCPLRTALLWIWLFQSLKRVWILQSTVYEIFSFVHVITLFLLVSVFFFKCLSLCTYDHVWAWMRDGCRAVGGFLFELLLGEVSSIIRSREMRQRGAAVSQSVTQFSGAVGRTLWSWLFPHLLPICLTPRKQQQLQTINYPPITLLFKKKIKNHFISFQNDKIPAAAITACLCCI